ncbi:MAG TPA: hypothetical protein VJ608_01425 [Albitalea sp.]|nr:hypothetical protein [Albitalea sp.]
MSFDKEVAKIEGFRKEFTRGNMKAAMKVAADGSSENWKVRIDQLKTAPGFNTRIMTPKLEAHIRSIADSIRANGFYSHMPLTGYTAVEGDKIVVYITGGHNRLAGARLAAREGAEIDKLPVVIVDKGTTMEDLTVQLVTTNTGSPLTTFEKGLVCKRLVNYGWDVDKICERLGLASKQYVESLLDLVGAPMPVREMVIKEEASAEVAIEALRKYGDRAYDELQAALGKARASGKTKVTRQHMAGAIYKKAVKKAAPVILDTLRSVTSDPGYAHISAGLREKLDKVLADLAAVEEQDKTAAAAAAGANGADGQVDDNDDKAASREPAEAAA